MRENTTNLGLVKPDKTDQYNVTYFNENMQKIDDFAGLTPPKALTADKLTVPRNINGIAFDGTKNVITGIGLHSMTETYSNTNVVYGFDESNQLALFRSKQDGNIGHATSESDYWEKINLEALDLDTTNQTKALTTGNVSSNPDVYADILERAHSTFDKSKFEVVGSPVITDDGIASGFSGSNYITTSEFKLGNGAWRYSGSFITGNDVTGLQIISCLKGSGITFYNACGAYINNNKLYLSININGSVQTASVDVSPLTYYNFALNFKNPNYVFEVNNEVIKTYNSSELVSFNQSNLVMSIGQYSYSGSAYSGLTGSIDLKSIAIWADGVPVFNGNKTGLYIAKSDNYEVVGSPTISEDGILSNVSRANNVNTGLLRSDLFSKSFYMITPFVLSLNNIDGVNVHLLHWDISAGGSNGSIRLSSNPTMGTYTCNWQIKTSEGVLILSYSTNSVDKLLGCYMAIFDKATLTYSFYHSFDGINYELVDTATRQSTPQYSSGSENIYMCRGDLNVTYNASFDLNTCKFGTDGNLVYQPCLKIPYTESKTGSKIVDVAYRDRVQDLYEQTGEALFYTLDEENQDFTLPAGDIYGMIEKSRNGKMPVGTIFAHTCSADFVPENSLPCDGSEYTESQFPNLYVDWLISGRLNTCTYEEYQQDITTYGKCAKFAIDTVNHTFKVPTIPNGTFIQQAMSDDELGKAYNAGLPNITGTVGAIGLTGGQYTGAFYYASQGGPLANTGEADYNAGFDASLSNPIYNNSDTVQPEAVALRYFVVVATDTINQSVMDWSEWATGLQTKLNADHSNDTKPYIIESYENDLNGYITYSNGLHIEYGVNNIPADGNGNVTLIKQYKNTNYLIFTSLRDISFNIGKDCGTGAMPLTEGSFTIRQSVQNAINVQWHTLGYINLGE